jgi:hypothetical protein
VEAENVVLGFRLVPVLDVRVCCVPDGDVQIISDLFRDHDLSGWSKALWFIALLFCRS